MGRSATTGRSYSDYREDWFFDDDDHYDTHSPEEHMNVDARPLESVVQHAPTMVATAATFGEETDTADATLARWSTAEELNARPSNISSPTWPVLTHSALVQLQMQHARQRIGERQLPYGRAFDHAGPPAAQARASEVPANEPSVSFRHAGQDHPGVPLAHLRPPPSWMPRRFDVLRVSRKWREVVWVWNESSSESHQGVGLLTMQWLHGPGPHLMPRVDGHVLITDVGYDEAGMNQLQMSAVVPCRWTSGSGIWMLRWLHGM